MSRPKWLLARVSLSHQLWLLDVVVASMMLTTLVPKFPNFFPWNEFHEKFRENDFTKILGRRNVTKYIILIPLQSVSVVVVCWKMNLSSQNFCCQSSRCFYFSHFSLLIKVNFERFPQYLVLIWKKIWHNNNYLKKRIF